MNNTNQSKQDQFSNQSHNHKILSELTPNKLWLFFAELSNIPRPSEQEQGVRDWLIKFATDRNLSYKQDKIGNFFIYKPAQNSNSTKTILLQQHMDMVCEKDPEINLDFSTDPIVLRQDGDFIYATGTTLGADNGIGLVASLSILDDQNISHPSIEAVFTMNEETGMDGIMYLDQSLISADYVLNLDTEEEGSVYVSSAGTRDVEIIINPTKINFAENLKKDLRENNKPEKALQIQISGLRGGHSGVNIHENRLNSNKILGVLLQEVQFEILLVDITGGSKRNAIPRYSQAVIVLDDLADDLADDLEGQSGKLKKSNENLESIQTKLQNFANKIINNYQDIEPEISITITPTITQSCFDKKSTLQILNILNNTHSGVYQVSSVVPDLVQTSNNLGVIENNNGVITMVNMARSSDDFELDLLVKQLLGVVQTACNVQFSGFDKAKIELLPKNMSKNVLQTNLKVILSATTAGWKAQTHNPLLDIFQTIHTKVTGQKAEVKAVHAGLECGFLKDYLPKSSVISFGPQIDDAHSPKEHVKISSVQEFYNVLVELVAVL